MDVRVGKLGQHGGHEAGQCAVRPEHPSRLHTTDSDLTVPRSYRLKLNRGTFWSYRHTPALMLKSRGAGC